MNPSPAVFYNGQGSVNADQLNTFGQVCQNYAQLRGFTGLSNMLMVVLGETSPGDGGGGLFYYNSTSTATDNNYTVIVPTGNVQGAWLALEFQDSYISSGTVSGISMTSNTPITIAQITLTPGTWDIWASFNAVPAATTTVSYIAATVSLTTNTYTSVSDDINHALALTFTTGQEQILPIGKTRLTITASTTYYLVAQVTFAVSTLTGAGIISATQVF